MTPQLLWFTRDLYQQIERHARDGAPREICGVLMGTCSGGTARVREVLAVPNIAANPEQAYRLDDRRLAQIVGGLASSSLEIVGFYHSHPSGEPIPSQTDVRLAAYPDIPYIIMGLKGGEAAAAAWRITPTRVDRLDIVVSDSEPEAPPEPMSDVQKWAILTSTVMAFVLVIILALSLLPPAPKIPH